MKRYQCIKNVFAFNKGRIYAEVDGPPTYEGRADLILQDGRIYEINKMDMLDHFHELMDINIDDHEEQAYIALQPVHGCLRLIAICVAAAGTIGLIIYLALTWRS